MLHIPGPRIMGRSRYYTIMLSNWLLAESVPRFCSGSHELRVIKRDEIFSLSILKLPADFENDH